MQKYIIISLFLLLKINIFSISDEYLIFYSPTVKNLRFRNLPGLNGQLIKLLNPEDKLKLLKIGNKVVIDNIEGNWVYLETDNYENGWCFSGYLKIVEKIHIDDLFPNIQEVINILKQDDKDLLKNENIEKNDMGGDYFYNLKNKNIVWSKSKNQKYIFIASKSILSPDIPENNSDFAFDKKCWWIIYNLSENKILFKDTGLLLYGFVEWLDNIDYFYFDFGTSPFRALVFYNLKNPKISFSLSDKVVSKSFYFSKDLKYIVWNYYLNDMPEGDPIVGAMIKKIETNQNIKINDIKNKSLERLYEENWKLLK